MPLNVDIDPNKKWFPVRHWSLIPIGLHYEAAFDLGTEWKLYFKIRNASTPESA